MKNVLITGPILSRSGYGEMARFAYRALKNRQDVEIFIEAIAWGNTGWLFDDNEERREIDALIAKTAQYFQAKGGQAFPDPFFDISLQVTIPNEWKKRGLVNIGYTAGIETNMISPAWLQPSSGMDKIVVISEHAKNGFVNTVFGNQQGQHFRVTTPIEVIHLPFRNAPSEDLELNLKHDFNFLAVCQWGPRKNLDMTIKGFLEEFYNEEVGLVLKINTANDSIRDRELTKRRLQMLLNAHPNRKCSIVLIHGHLSEGQMQTIYTNPKIKAIVSTTHGEGFGLPLMEAAANAIPVIATDWSGHTDFLYMDGKRMFGKVNFELKPIAKEHVWPGVLEEGTSWAYPIMSSYKEKMRELYKDYGRFKQQAKKLSSHVLDMMNEKKLNDSFFSKVVGEQKPMFEELQSHMMNLGELDKEIVVVD
jgi:glycosyltransferase involved in cell wall biosynthesis